MLTAWIRLIPKARRLPYLPPTRRTSTPIEQAWSNRLNNCCARGLISEPSQTIGLAMHVTLADITAQDSFAWFLDCGYGLD